MPALSSHNASRLNLRTAVHVQVRRGRLALRRAELSSAYNSPVYPAHKGKNMNLNRVELIGFVGSEPEANFTSNGKAVTSLSLATKTSWLKGDERQERTGGHSGGQGQTGPAIHGIRLLAGSCLPIPVSVIVSLKLEVTRHFLSPLTVTLPRIRIEYSSAHILELY
jgi:hypothetical protein